MMLLNTLGKQKQLILIVMGLVAIASIAVPFSTLSATSDGEMMVEVQAAKE